jgi:hypothetical protein
MDKGKETLNNRGCYILLDLFQFQVVVVVVVVVVIQFFVYLRAYSPAQKKL